MFLGISFFNKRKYSQGGSFMKKVLLAVLLMGGTIAFGRPGEVGIKDFESVSGFCEGGRIISTKKASTASDGITALPASARVKYPLCKIDGLKYRNITVVIKSWDYDFDSSNVQNVSLDGQNIAIDYNKRIIYVKGDIFVDYSN